MNEPRIQVIGVHWVECTDELLHEAVEDKYDRKPGQWGYRRAAKQARKEIESAVLIELILPAADGKLDLGKFLQFKGTAASPNDQCAWWEKFLTADGNAVLSDSEPVADVHQYRVAFFLHFYDPTKPLQTPFGPLSLPSATPMPERLAKLCPYENTD